MYYILIIRYKSHIIKTLKGIVGYMKLAESSGLV